MDGPGRGIPRRLRAGRKLNGAVGAGVGSTQGKDLHDVSIGAPDLAATRHRPAHLGGLTVTANDADVARMWHETANDTAGGVTQQEAHPR